MTPLIAGYSTCLKALVLLGFFSQIAVSNAYAVVGPNLHAIPPQTIVAEQPFNYRINVDSAASEQTQKVGMRLVNAPEGATLIANGDNSYQFRWTPPANVGEKTVIIVQAFHITKPNLLSTQRIVLQRGNAAQVKAATNTSGVASAGVASADVASAGVASASVVVASNNAIGSRFVTPSNTTSSNTATSFSSSPAVRTATPSQVQPETRDTASAGNKPDFRIAPPVEPPVKPLIVEAPEVAEADANRIASLHKSLQPSSLSKPSDIPAPEVESIASQRPELPELGLQYLTVGEEFQFFIRPIIPDDVDVTMKLSAESLPVGATFEDVFEVSKMLRWKPIVGQEGEHQMVLVLVAEDETSLSVRTEREVTFLVEPAPPVELAPEIAIEPISAQIVSAGRKVNIRVKPIVSDEKTAQIHVDRLPAGGSFDENKDGTRTFHWPTTQADEGEHTFRFTAVHPDNADLVANVNVLIVVGSPDGPGTDPNVVDASSAVPPPAAAPPPPPPPPTPELDAYPSAESPSPIVDEASPAPEPYPSADSTSPTGEPYPSPDQASPEPLAVRPPPAPSAN